MSRVPRFDGNVARCRSTYASNRPAGNQHATYRFFAWHITRETFSGGPVARPSPYSRTAGPEFDSSSLFLFQLPNPLLRESLPGSPLGQRQNWQKHDDESIGRTHPGLPDIGRILGAESASDPRRALTVLKAGALSHLDNVTVRIADVAANLAVLWYRRREELGSSTFP
jgi:hypothetical protein